LLFGLLGGGGLFALLKIDISKAVHRRKLNIAGAAVGAFCVALLLSSAAFVLLKHSSFLEEEGRPEQVALFKALTLDEAVAIAAERKALRKLDLSNSEESAALERTIAMTKDDGAAIKDRATSLSQGLDAGSVAAANAAKIVLAAKFPAATQEDAGLSEWQSSIGPVLTYSGGLLKKCAGQVTSTSSMPLSCDVYVRFMVSKFESSVGNRSMVPESDLTKLSAYPEVLDALMQLQDSLDVVSARLRDMSPGGLESAGGDVTERVNKVLENVFRYEQQTQGQSDLSKYFAVLDRSSGLM
jgi:hypothetical protein